MITNEEFAQRRQRLFSLLEPHSVAIFYSGVGKVSSADETYPFEVNRNFFYLTGIDQEDSALLLVNSDGEAKEYLYISPFDARKEKWYGKRLTLDEAARKSGINNVLVNTSLSAKLDAALNPNISEFGEIRKIYLDLDREIKIAEDTTTIDQKKIFAVAYNKIPVLDSYPLVTSLRLRKSSKELDELDSAIASTKLGITSVMSMMHEGAKEYEMADLFLHVINDSNGYEGLAFPTIMASGAHGACLHYPTPLDTIKNGDLLLMDLGARKNYYCADVTRTVPVNGKFSAVQKAIYQIVLGCNKMIISQARPGLTIAELQKMAVEYLASECLAKCFIKSKEEITNYYFHNISHFIGLDTHDPYLSPCSGAYKDVPLEPGMVISDEPGLYMEDRGIGIRIEDDLLITDRGCEVLTRDIIKEIPDIERYLASKK